ncbi:phospholipase D family protein [Candidatus Thiodiazotropha sp. LNASS1]|uniref:phospholipase D family protein n=1 Tax=Candidatus Thiodiazotropha sp. LNASS1 TaxID=3096260 RepID=UPI0034DFCC7C
MLLEGESFSQDLLNSISKCNKSFVACSAFIKSKALDTLLAGIQDIEIIIVARWQKQDLISGASDLEAYQLCKERGWKFGISQNFHGKVYLVDQSSIFLGSANLTQKGLNIGSLSNIEFGTTISASRADLDKIEQFLETEVVWLDEYQFKLLKEDIDSTERYSNPISELHWPDNIQNKLLRSVSYLWVHDLVFNAPQVLLCLNLDETSQLHDFDLLSLDIDALTAGSLRSGFKRTRLYLWVISQLRQNQEMNFGAFSQALHNALLDDPTPYRKEVKEFIATLFAWLELLSDEFEVTQHRKTSSVRLKI